MGRYTIILSSEEEKALLTEMLSIQFWISNAIHNKARQCMDKVILENSDKQPSKISNLERLQIVRDAEVETAVEINARIEGVI